MINKNIRLVQMYTKWYNYNGILYTKGKVNDAMIGKSYLSVQKGLINTARGEEAPDLILRGGKIVDVFSGKITDGDIRIRDGYIAAVGNYSDIFPSDGDIRIVELDGRYVSPGFVNAHVHVESSMVLPAVYSREEIRHGVTTLITDPHEIANVGGLPAVECILGMTEALPINYFVMLPSCVPSTPFENAGAVLDADDLVKLKDNRRVLGLGEMMNVPGVLGCSDGVMDKLSAFYGKIIDGHAPLLSGHELSAYAAAGIMTDHEAVSFDEALEKLRAGIAVLVREGSASKNLDAVIRGVVENDIDTHNIAFCTDDKHLSDVCAEGTVRCNIQKAIALGLSPVKAYQMATINAARIYGLRHIGGIAPSYKADLVILDDLNDVSISAVYKDGTEFGELDFDKTADCSEYLLNSVNYAPMDASSFALEPRDKYSVIGIVDRQIITKRLEYSRDEAENALKSGELLKIAVIERHHATGNIGVGLIRGYGLQNGAVATTVAHDSHNIIVVGSNDDDMLAAVEELKRIRGGYSVVSGGKILGSLSLSFGGLMSTLSADEFIPELEKTIRSARSLGVNPNIDPFITLSFMALPVIPEIRITDMGVIEM